MASKGLTRNGRTVAGKTRMFSATAGAAQRGKPAKRTAGNKQSRKSETTSELLLRFAGVIDDPCLPRDLSTNHDHYLYGVPKKP